MYGIEVMNKMNKNRTKLEDNNLSRREIEVINQQIKEYKERVKNESQQ